MDTIQTKAALEIRKRQDELSEELTVEYYRREPALLQRYGEKGKQHVLRDNKYHLSFLSRALLCDSPALFNEYISWAKVFLTKLGIPAHELENNLRVIRDVLKKSLPADMGEYADQYLSEAIKVLPDLPTEIASFIREDNPHKELAETYLDLLLNGKRNEAGDLITSQVPERLEIRELYMNVFEPCQHEIGRLWQSNEISVAREHYCTAATQLIMSRLYSHLFNGAKNGRVLVATCIAEDLHEMGIRMVADFFELDGWDTYYLGANTPQRSIIETIEEQNADVLAVSATMTYHVDSVTELITATRKALNGKNLKILVGGYPFKCDPGLWEKVHADGFAFNAREAVAIA